MNYMRAYCLERGLRPCDGGKQQFTQLTVEQEQGVQIIETRARPVPVITSGQACLSVEEQILVAIDDRIIALAPEHMTPHPASTAMPRERKMRSCSSTLL